MADLIGRPRDGMVAVGLMLNGLIPADKLDDAFARVLREIEPQMEVAAGLMGITRVHFTDEYARAPYPEEVQK